MKEVKIFARAGQGAITTATVLGESLFTEGKYSYAFPNFGAARMGAPMNAFIRFDDNPVRLRSQIYEPDYIIVIDPSLIKSQNCFAGMKAGGIAIVCSDKEIDIDAPEGITVVSLPAEQMAMETIGKPYANTVLLGAFAKATGALSLDSVLTSVKNKFAAKPEIIEQNLAAVKKGYEAVN